MPNITQIQVGVTTYTIVDEIANNNINSITTSLYSLSTSLTTMAFQADVPNDNKEYIRKNGSWSELISSSTIIISVSNETINFSF